MKSLKKTKRNQNQTSTKNHLQTKFVFRLELGDAGKKDATPI
ncbi:hypothetical protein ACQBEH_00395 [Brevibacillus laterosporus]